MTSRITAATKSFLIRTDNRVGQAGEVKANVTTELASLLLACFVSLIPVPREDHELWLSISTNLLAEISKNCIHIVDLDSKRTGMFRMLMDHESADFDQRRDDRSMHANHVPAAHGFANEA